MKKMIYVFLLFFTFLPFVQALEIDSKNAILYQLNENKVIYEKNAYDKVPIASLTKIMTAMVAIENIEDLEETVVLTSEDFQGLIEANASMAGFEVGDVVTYKDLLYGLLLPSGAEAAYALARNTFGSIDSFVDKMNEKAQDLNLNNTHFVNTTGLDDINHYSTVYEVAQIFKYALSNETFKEIVTTKSYTTTNGLLFKSTLFSISDRYDLDIDYVQGGKTGTTTNAGLCLASFANEDGISYLLVTTGGLYTGGYYPININDAKTLYEYYIDNYGYQKILNKNDLILTLPTKYLKQDKVSFYIDDDINYYMVNDYDKEDIIFTYDGIGEVDNKLKLGDKLGTLTVSYKNEKIKDIDIVLEEKISFDYIAYLSDHMEILYCFSGLVLIIIVIFITKKRKSQN